MQIASITELLKKEVKFKREPQRNHIRLEIIEQLRKNVRFFPDIRNIFTLKTDSTDMGCAEVSVHSYGIIAV